MKLQRHELREAARALLQRRARRACARPARRASRCGRTSPSPSSAARLVRGGDDLHPARDRQLVRADALAHAVVQHLGGGAGDASPARPRAAARRRRAAAARRRRTCARPPSGCRRADGVAAPSPWPAAASRGSPPAPSRGGCRTACRSRSRRTPTASLDAPHEVRARVLVGVRASGATTPKPQNAQPTVQTLETLMLRLTTNVTRSPASSARSSSAAWRMSSITSGRLSANIASSSSGASACPSRARSIVSGRGRPGRCRARGMNDA